MVSEDKIKLRNFAILSVAVLFSISVAAPHVSGDILGQGIFKMEQTIVPPPVITPNETYKGATFEWNYTMINNTLTGLLRVHVNFATANTTEFWNILEMVNVGNLTGNFTALIDQYAKIGSYTLNATYTSTISAYISHTPQNSSNPGTQLLNNTTAGPFQLFPADEVSYYIGVIYTMPPDLPPYVSQNLNALGEYINFTFTFQFG